MSSSKPTHLHVEIREVDGNSLLVAESRVVPFNLTDRPRTAVAGVGPRVSPVVVYESGMVVNPSNGAAIISPEVTLTFSVIVAKPTNGQKVVPWAVVSTHGTEATWAAESSAHSSFKEEHRLTCQAVLADDHEWGCIQLRCIEDHVEYGRKTLFYNDLLTVFLYRNREGVEDTPFPPMLTLCPLADQNYAPLRPGQMLQVVANQSALVEDHQSSGDRALLYYNQSRVGRSTSLVCHRYECLRQSAEHQILYVNGPSSAGVIVCPICQTGDDYYCYVFNPYNTVVDCVNLTSVRLRFATAIPRIKSVPSNYLDLTAANSLHNEITVRFVKPLRSLLVSQDKGVLTFKPVGR